MTHWETACKAWAGRQPPPRTEALQETVRRSQAALAQGIQARPLSRLGFLRQQLSFVKGRWWILQAAVLLVLWQVLSAAGSGYDVPRAMGILAALFVVLVMPELTKNRAAGAMEVECTTYYTLRHLYAARLLLFTLADLVLLTLFFSAALATGRVTGRALITEFLLPCLVTACICFRTLSSPRPWAVYASLPLTMVWVAVWTQIVLSDRLYPLLTPWVWTALLALALGYLALCLGRLNASFTRFWEENPSWN